jgi:hypothetical protein
LGAVVWVEKRTMACGDRGPRRKKRGVEPRSRARIRTGTRVYRPTAQDATLAVRTRPRRTDGSDRSGAREFAPCYSMKINLKHGDKLPLCGEKGRMLRPHRDARGARPVGQDGRWLRRLRRSHKDGYVPCRWCPGGSGISDGPGLLSGGHLGQRLMLHDSIVVRRRICGVNAWERRR